MRQLFDQFLAAFLIICVLITTILLPLGVIYMLHVGPGSNIGANGTLTTSFWADDKHKLRNDCLSRCLVNIIDIAGSVDSPNFANLIVVINNWDGIVKEILHSLLNYVRIVIWSSTIFGALHAPLLHHLLRDIEVNDLLRFAHTLLEELSLVNGARESINYVTLQKETKVLAQYFQI